MKVDAALGSHYLRLVMNPLEIQKAIKRAPFVPFRLHLSSGKRVDVYTRSSAFLTKATLHLGHPVMDPTEDIPDHADAISLLHVARLEVLDASDHSARAGSDA